MFSIFANPIASLFEIHDAWYALILIVSVSLVYAATRHERMRAIWTKGLGCIVNIVLLLAAAMAAVALLDWWS